MTTERADAERRVDGFEKALLQDRMLSPGRETVFELIAELRAAWAEIRDRETYERDMAVTFEVRGYLAALAAARAAVERYMRQEYDTCSAGDLHVMQMCIEKIDALAAGAQEQKGTE